MSKRVAVIILNYRTVDLTVQCLRSLEGQIGPDREVVVVDNDSRDGSAGRIEAAIAEHGFGTWARVVRSAVNGGFAAGNNLGIRSTQADAYILLNSDTIVRPGAIDALVGAMSVRPDAGLIGPSFENGDGRDDESTFRELRPLSELVRSADTGPISRVLPSWDLPLAHGGVPMECDWIGFACVLIRQEVIDAIGLLDDGYFMYFEDIDYCRRAREAGFRVLCWPDARVVHLLGGSSSVTSAVRRRAPRYYYESRARYFVKFHGRRGLWLANVLFEAGHLISRGRALLGHRRSERRRREPIDVWINALRPLRSSSAKPEVRAHETGDEVPNARWRSRRA